MKQNVCQKKTKNKPKIEPKMLQTWSKHCPKMSHRWDPQGPRLSPETSGLRRPSGPDQRARENRALALSRSSHEGLKTDSKKNKFQKLEKHKIKLKIVPFLFFAFSEITNKKEQIKNTQK